MSNKALFLDRDGIINVDKGYVGRIEEFEFVDGIFPVIRYFVGQEFQPVIVTNQSGIGRGQYTEAQFHTLCDWMQERFHEQGLAPVPVYYCPHHPTEAYPPYRQHCQCRKPEAGMLFNACVEQDLDAGRSIMIGDSWRDMEAAKKAGVPTRILVSKDKIPEPQLTQGGVVQVSSLTEILQLSIS